MPSEGGGQRPDPRALQLASLLQERTRPHSVYLFGSRARGDWQEQSDIDLMILSSQRLDSDAIYSLARDLQKRADQVYAGEQVPLQILNLSDSEFAWGRTSPHHLAGNVQREGLKPTGEHMPRVKQDNPWPASQERLRTVYREMCAALTMHGSRDALYTLFHVQQALENALKGFLSACRAESWRKTHDLASLAQEAAPHIPEVVFPDQSQLKHLTEVRVEGPCSPSMELKIGPAEALARAQTVCSQLAARTLALCGKTPVDAGYRQLHADLPEGTPLLPLDLTRPLGGLEDVAPGIFDVQERLQATRRASLAEGREEGREEGRRESLLSLALDMTGGDTAAVAALRSELESANPKDWPSASDIVRRFRDA